jgi:hypothetical protein
MKIAWAILIVSVIVDIFVVAGAGIGAAMVEADKGSVSWAAIAVAFAGAGLQALRTIQSELRAVGIKLSDLLREAIKKAGGAVPPLGGRPLALMGLLTLAVCTMGAACATPGMSADELKAIVQDKNAAAACGDVKAPYPISVLWVNADKDVLGKMKLTCGSSSVEIDGKAPAPR